MTFSHCSRSIAYLKRQADVVVVVGCLARVHEQGGVLVAGGLEHLDAGRTLEQTHGLQIGARHDVDLVGLQRAGARADVRDVQGLDRVEVGPALLPVVGFAVGCGAHARVELLEHVAAGADTALPVHSATVLGRADDQMVVADQVREVGAAAGQLEHHRVLAVRLDVLDRGDDALGGRLGILAAVMVERGDDVVGIERLAVVELHALAQLEGPGRGIGRSVPALGQLADEIAVRRDFGQVVAQLAETDVDHVAVEGLRRIEHVARAAAGDGDPQPPALLGRRPRLAGERARRRRRNTKRGRAEQEITAVDPPFSKALFEVLDLRGHYRPPGTFFQSPSTLSLRYPPSAMDRRRTGRESAAIASGWATLPAPD